MPFWLITTLFLNTILLIIYVIATIGRAWNGNTWLGQLIFAVILFATELALLDATNVITLT